MVEFVAFPKIARLNRDIVVTEKIDGTNAAVVIGDDGTVAAQSRSRILAPGKATDNFGFAAWVEQHAEALRGLGPGHHFGEWYGQGIQRTYGLKERRFALFNVMRWTVDEGQAAIFKEVAARVPGLEVVPLLYRGPRLQGPAVGRPTFTMPDGRDVGQINVSYLDIPEWIIGMMKQGRLKNLAVPGYEMPEGIVVLHLASKQLYKVTLDGDEAPKGKAAQSPS